MGEVKGGGGIAPPLLALAFTVTCAFLPPSPGTVAPRRIVPGLPALAETIELLDGTTITIDGDDHVTVSGDGESWFGFNGYGYRRSVAFMAGFQEAIRAGDPAAAAERMAFPLRVNGRRALIVRDRDELRRRFEQVFPENVVRRILAADPRKVSCNCRGIWLGDGVVWARKDADGRYGVFAVNP